MRTAKRLYVLLCIAVGVCMQSGTANPDYFMGGFYGLMGSFIGPGIIAKGLASLFGLGSLPVVGVLAVSIAFWLLVSKIAKRPRRASAPAVATALPAGWEGFQRTRTIHSEWEEE